MGQIDRDPVCLHGQIYYQIHNPKLHELGPLDSFFPSIVYEARAVCNLRGLAGEWVGSGKKGGIPGSMVQRLALSRFYKAALKADPHR